MRQVDCPRGIVHVHTTCSHDGLLEPGEIARMCRERGLAFAAISDHAEDMDERSTAALVQACADCSGDGFVLIPGIEHRFQRGVHILALGQNRFVGRASLMDTFQVLLSAGCALVAAHCRANEDLPVSLLEMLTAVEIWNVGRHTRFLPASGCMAAYRKWATEHGEMFAIGGLDMHAGCEWGCEIVLDGAYEASGHAVIDALKAGRFSTQGRFVSFGSRPARGFGEIIFAAGDALMSVRDIRNRVLCRG